MWGENMQNRLVQAVDASRMIENDLHYLRSILGHLQEMRGLLDGPSLGGEILADNIDWLDCYITRLSILSAANRGVCSLG